MHNGLLAPQFGLGRFTAPIQQPVTQPLLEPQPSITTVDGRPQGAPVVIVKRRRHHLDAPAQTQPDSQEPGVTAREGKVYRMDSHALDAAPAAPAPVVAEPASAPVLPLRRRRRNPERAPRLLSHVHFDRPAVEVPSNGELPTVDAHSLLDPLFVESIEREYRELMQALKGLEATVDGLLKGQELGARLDEALGISRSTRRAKA